MSLNKGVKIFVLALIILVDVLSFTSALVENVQINPEYPNLDSSVFVSADISDVDSADLIYTISGQSGVHTTSFSGPLVGDAVIYNGAPEDGAVVNYYIETFNSEGILIDQTEEYSFAYDGSAPIVNVVGASENILVSQTGVIAEIVYEDGINDADEIGYTISSTDNICSTNPLDYTIGDSVPVTEHSFICGYAKDMAGNEGFTNEPTEFKVFDNIQDAIDYASDGDTINIESGTYAESILINKQLILTGESTPIISGDDSSYNYIVKITADNVVFDNFEVNGYGSATGDNNFDYGIWLSNTNNVEVENSIVKNVWRNQGNGIQVDDSTNSIIHDNVISSFQKRGIRYINSDGEFYENEVVGDNVDGTSRVQNLVNIFDGSDIEVYSNNLHNALTEPGITPTWDSPGIFVSSYAWDGSEASSFAYIHDNEIYDGDSGIVVGSYYSAADASVAVIINNNLHDLNWAINFEKETVSATVNYNQFSNINKAINADDGNGGPATQPEINAENNWFGTMDASIIETLVYGNADFDPWWITSMGGNDITSPESHITLSGIQYITSLTFDLPFVASDDYGLKRVRVYENGAYWTYENVDDYLTSYSGTFSRTVVSDGVYSYYTRAVDVREDYGGIEDAPLTADVTVIVDTTDPVISIISPLTDGEEIDAMSYFLVKANADDLTSGIDNVVLTLTKDGETEPILENVPMNNGILYYEYSMRMWELEAGDYTLEITATDKAGNPITETRDFSIAENVAPSRIIGINTNVPIEGGEVSFRFNVTTRGDGNIKFGMDEIAGWSPSGLNASISQ
ncbi:right-handed parallel beta-helix repeat-containing protein, partial [Patescibacteria group bacterium]|nr:right-handed parallel beta-helix repeat-containing protein [Patescibacteria group bacterium]